MAFTPWITLEGYADLLDTIADLGLVENVSPVQLAIRLLIPAGSRLLELPEVRGIVGPFDPVALSYRWDHPDPRVDALQRDIERHVQALIAAGHGRNGIFGSVRHMVGARSPSSAISEASRLPDLPPIASRATVPYLTEPWYC